MIDRVIHRLKLLCVIKCYVYIKVTLIKDFFKFIIHNFEMFLEGSQTIGSYSLSPSRSPLYLKHCEQLSPSRTPLHMKQCDQIKLEHLAEEKNYPKLTDSVDCKNLEKKHVP